MSKIGRVKLFNNDQDVNTMMFILAVISIIIVGVIVGIVITGQSHFTNDWFEITVQLPDEPDIAGAYLLYRPMDSDEWTVAGEVDGQAGEMVTIRVIDLPDGVYQVAAKVYDIAGNISSVKEPFDTVIIDRTPPDGVHADVIVPDGDMDNMSSMNEPSNKWSVVNMVMRCMVPFGAVYLCGRCCVKP